jgi:hypothetical protein
MLIQSASRIALLGRIGLSEGPKRATTLPAGMVYGVDDHPPLTLTLFAGLQWVRLINIYLVYLLILTREGRVPPATAEAIVAAAEGGDALRRPHVSRRQVQGLYGLVKRLCSPAVPGARRAPGAHELGGDGGSCPSSLRLIPAI